MEICVRDELITVPEYVIKKIPFFQTLKFAIEESKTLEMSAQEKSSNVLTFDSLSPRFLKIIIDYFKNDYEIDVLVTMLYGQFENNIIKQNLGYLCLEELYGGLYFLHHGILANGKLVIRYVTTRYYRHDTCYYVELLTRQEIELGNKYDQSSSHKNEIFFDIYNTKIILDESEAKTITDGVTKICNIYLMDFENYIKHSHLKYHGELSVFDYKNNKQLEKNFKNITIQNNKDNKITFNKVYPSESQSIFSTKELHDEHYLSNIRTIMTRGDLIQIPDFVIKKIPFIEERMKDVEKNHILNMDEIPPKFMKLLVIFINNDLAPDYMRYQFYNMYAPKIIMHHLQYIGMTDLIKQMNLVAVVSQTNSSNND
jgi:hypothetical protein